MSLVQKHHSVVNAVKNAFAGAVGQTIAATRLKSDGGRRITEAEFAEIAKVAFRNLLNVQISVTPGPTDEEPEPKPVLVCIVEEVEKKASRK